MLRNIFFMGLDGEMTLKFRIVCIALKVDGFDTIKKDKNPIIFDRTSIFIKVFHEVF